MAKYIDGNIPTLKFEIDEKGVRKEEYLDLNYFYSFYRGQLFERLMQLFVYKGWMPYPQRELEKRLLRSGIVAEVADPICGLMATYGSLSGVTEYYDMFKFVTYGNPVAKGGTLTIGKNAVVCYNNSTMLSVNAFIDRYASLLAHIDLSIRCAAINLRAQDILISGNEATRDTLDAWYSKLYNGSTSAILDKKFFNMNESVVNLAHSGATTPLTELLSSHTEIMRAFYRDIGVRFTKDKKSNMIVDEVTSDEQLLLFNIDDMLQCRRDFCEEHNRVFGARFDELNPFSRWGYKFTEYQPLTVELNPLFETISESEGKKDVDISTTDN